MGDRQNNPGLLGAWLYLSPQEVDAAVEEAVHSWLNDRGIAVTTVDEPAPG
ncbi:hypothetical protein ACFLWA_07610 [Chloroflexota bacterium]